jgi:hypothetical protein
MCVAAVQDPFRAEVAGLYQLLSRQRIGSGEVVLNGVKGMVILLNRWSGVDVRDEMRPVVIAARRHMDFVAYPLQTPLAAVAHVAVGGRAQGERSHSPTGGRSCGVRRRA